MSEKEFSTDGISAQDYQDMFGVAPDGYDHKKVIIPEEDIKEDGKDPE